VLVILTAVTTLAELTSLVTLVTKQSTEAAHTPCCSKANSKQHSHSGDSAYEGYFTRAAKRISATRALVVRIGSDWRERGFASRVVRVNSHIFIVTSA
jgi:hypothetical protein